MSPALKTLLIWFLMAILPVQGWAASFQSFCGPAHHQSMMDEGSAFSHHHDDGPAHGHAGQPLHAVDQAAMDDGQSITGAAPEQQHTASSHTASSCSACAACCASAAAPPAVTPGVPGHGTVQRVFPSLTSLVASVILASLERPPKRISA